MAAQTAKLTKPAMPNVQEAKLYMEGRTAPLWEMILVWAWFTVIFVTVPGATLIRYLCVLYFLLQVVLSYKTVIPVLARAWPLFLLPIFGLFSFIWSPYPSLAISSGIYFLLTPLILTVIISRMGARQILQCIMFAGMVATLITATMWGSIPDGGPYSHKNYLAVHMLFTLLLGLATLLDRTESNWLRLLTVPFILICSAIILQSGSATSLVLMLVGFMAMFSVRYLIVDLGRIRHMRTTILLTGIIVVLGVMMLFLSQPDNSLIASFFDALGKDTTFTGRTAIWKAGAEVSAEHPVFGVGLEGFWQYDVGTAQTLNENDSKEIGTKLGFHSAFLEVRVHLGYIGLGLFTLIVVWCTYQTFRRWAFDPTLKNSALLIITAIIIMMSFTEGWLWGVFNAVVSLFYISALATFGASKRTYIGKASITYS